MAWFGALVMLAGAGVSASGTAASGRKAKKAYLLNAAIQTKNAERAREAADFDILSLKRQATRTIGAQRAAFGASGVSGSSGSALDLLADSMAQATLDQQRRKYQGELEAQDYMNQAAMGISTGKATQLASQYSAAGQVLSGVASAASSLYKPSPTSSTK